MVIRTSLGAQRYNNRMNKVWERAMKARKDPVNKSHRRHNQKLSRAKSKSR
jgi:hypothetical protein